MVNDAEKFKEEDEKLKGQVEARNALESMAYSLKNQLGDQEKLGGKISEEDKATMEEAIEKVGLCSTLAFITILEKLLIPAFRVIQSFSRNSNFLNFRLQIVWFVVGYWYLTEYSSQAIKFLDEHPSATTEELETAKKDMESVVQPIVTKLYGEQPEPEKDEL